MDGVEDIYPVACFPLVGVFYLKSTVLDVRAFGIGYGVAASCGIRHKEMRPKIEVFMYRGEVPKKGNVRPVETYSPAHH
jgi:hypothetical protein